MAEVSVAMHIMEVMVLLFVMVIGFLVLLVLITYFRDVSQTANAIHHNYPVVGHFRGIFTRLGEFFRQYFFALDREEMPFNRAERNWVLHACDSESNTSAFGSTRLLSPPGTIIFVNCPFPTLEKDSAPTQPLVIGEGCEQPYIANSFFNVTGMSYGSLSKPAVLALSQGAKLAGCWMNTGEGGLSEHHLKGGCDIVFQMGTAKYGVRDQQGRLDGDKLKTLAAIEQVKMLEIKLSQGAKPGKGGILPAEKITKEIATIRGIAMGQDSISPNRHPEINNIDELLDFIQLVRQYFNKPVGIKFVLGAYLWLDELCQRIGQRGLALAPDFITLDSGDGGTGAAPMSLMDNVGLPIKQSLPMLVDILLQYGLKERIRVITSGKLLTPAEVAWALCAGADFINCGRGFMFSIGCIQAMRCNKNTCPTGVTTHKKRLQSGLDPALKAVKAANYARHMVREVEIIAHSCGVPQPRRLKRYHVRLVQQNGIAVPMSELYPYPSPIDSH